LRPAIEVMGSLKATDLARVRHGIAKEEYASGASGETTLNDLMAEAERIARRVKGRHDLMAQEFKMGDLLNGEVSWGTAQTDLS